ncbi:Methyltransferase domain-containing protein [Prauserella aidingensis]|uniref:Eco57I restriction-modification methylase domain-containing protein n=1 Tax=Prauserella aidingensis TaxID=387890 RepID=UPI0020A4DBFA|nr:type IIL restriction-modification enzyme MmeI [Prauserella aidingensis]MCP2256046.1 Methyltransferase domain-containing protein [Prauserella aidingensis]
MSARTSGRGRRSHAPDSAQQHRDWLNLIEVSGPFLSLPVLRQAWPSLDALDKTAREGLRQAHADWLADPDAGQQVWIRYVLGELLGWDGEQEGVLHWHAESALDPLAMDVGEHDTSVVPDFALVQPGEDAKPATTELLGMVCPPGSPPTARVKGESWAATPVDRLAQLCRQHEVELGLATDGRWWTLVWAPRRKVTTTATFDAASWPEKSEEYVVRAFVSLLNRQRFSGVPDDEKLVTLLDASKDSQEDITEALGVQVRQAVELLVAAIGRADSAQRGRGEQGLDNVEAHEVYRGAVSVMMRLVFVLFAEERGLLPADNELYANAYSAGRLCEVLEQQAREGSEDDLEHSSQRWHRLLALFDAVYHGVEHPKLTMHAHDGSLFDPGQFAWLPRTIDDRTVLHMLRAVQYVQVGTGKNKELRKLSFRELDVEQIGYVYEGLLAYDGFRAGDVVLGLIGKAGVEKEVGLRELEDLAAGTENVSALAKKLAEEYKDYKIGTPKALEKALAPLSGTELENARRKLLAATDGDAALTERLLPFYGVIRQDLRELPVVIMPGELYVTDSPLRKNTGTHYTPRELAEEVVEGALEPLVYEPGPLQTADRSEWKLKSSAEILSLKIADIAMGSAAFLVAAARYLGGKLLEAWTREGDDRVRDYQVSTPISDADVDPVVVEARREIIEHCLYGADINKMAVEMAKLSLWLVSMDPSRPFTFLDDRLVAGDSLLGITSLDQLEYMHMDPKKGRELHDRLDPQLLANVRSVVAEVAEDRRKLTEVDGSTLEGLNRKRAILEESALKTSRARIFADLAVGAALAHAGRGDRGLAAGSIAAADYARRFDTTEMEARKQAREWLDTDLPDGNFIRETLHWPLVFPEVFEQDGFDAVIGNPPFLGGKKISGASGSAYREYLVQAIGGGVKGNADLIAYFALRAHGTLNHAGQTGLIATNTLAQGDTREVGLDQLGAGGVTIRQSTKSKPWPSKSAALEYCAIWTSRKALSDGAERRADGVIVPAITASLDPESRATGNPERLARNRGISFQGSNVLGTGFTMEPERAHELIASDERNRDVLFPYLNGQDINSSPTASPSRWVINFHDWSEDKARKYPECYEQVRSDVRAERAAKSKDVAEWDWWRYWRPRPNLYQTIAGLERVIVLTRHTKICMPAIVPTGQVFSDALGVFASDNMAMLALLSSAQHFWWAKTRGSTLGAGIRYTPSDVFETFPLPELTGELRELGERLDTYRRDVMLSRNAGLTKTYNLVFDPGCRDEDIEELRRIHREIDEAAIRAYGWEDRVEAVGGLDHGFHPVGRETRYTIGPAAQREVLDSLLELNHERYAEEVAQGLHDKKGKARGGGEQGALL